MVRGDTRTWTLPLIAIDLIHQWSKNSLALSYFGAAIKIAPNCSLTIGVPGQWQWVVESMFLYPPYHYVPLEGLVCRVYTN